MSANPQPFYFGAPGEGLFAWLHRPTMDLSSGLGLVVCNPFGFEEVCAHRSLRHVAQAAAAAGVPTLRFDYAGCGNSEGDEFQPDRLAAWVRSIHRAVDALKQASGVVQVALLGVRLGAALAALAAAERDDVVGLIAVAPVVRGRAYVRELTILGEAGAAPLPPSTDGEGLLESAGFVLTAQTSADLGAIDLRQLPRSPAPRVVIAERDDMSAALNWAADLERLGARVRSVSWPGYAAMMRDPQRSQVPQAIVEGVVASLTAWRAELPIPPGVPQALGTDFLLTPTVRERAVHIDSGVSPLFGVLARQDGAGPQPAVLMLNSGSVHHVGPNRLWVRLARNWATRGVTVLRLDISGIADSPPQPGAEENVVYSRQAASDIAAALAWLREHAAATECHVMGLCSGGYHALKAAMTLQDVASALMVNPLTYYWKEGTEMSDFKDYEVSGLAAKFRSQLFTARTWKKLLSGKVDVRIVAQVARRRLLNAASPHALRIARALNIPLKNDLARDLGRVVRKGVRLQFVFAQNAPGFELLERQAGPAIRRLVERHQVTLDFVPDADHTFTRIAAREHLVSLLEARMLGDAMRG